MKESSPVPKSPFYAKVYGGYTKGQEGFYRDQLCDLPGKIVFDPMAGQGYSISSLVLEGCNVWLSDLNPAPLMLAALRDPCITNRWKELSSWFRKWLLPMKPKQDDNTPLEYVDEWISPSIREELKQYVSLLGLEALDSPFSNEDSFWSSSLEARFAACLPILAAREITCFRTSDNTTWLKQGGLAREKHIYEPIIRALEGWCKYAEKVEIKKEGTLNIRRANVEVLAPNNSPLADIIVTSPPYANRLDYSRLWAPELEVLTAMWNENSYEFKEQQIGSTVVKGKQLFKEDEALIPERILEALEEIRTDSSSYSESYYYPFFRNYSVSLAKSFYAMAGRLAENGTIIIFVRDTVRKDVMFPTSSLIYDVLVKNLGFCETIRSKHIIRSHVGLLRRSSTASIYGLAQQEWWLAFQKG